MHEILCNNGINSIVVSDLNCRSAVSTRASPSQHCSAVWPQHFQPQCYKSWQCRCHALCVWHPFTVHYPTSCTSHVICLDQNTTRQEEAEAEKRTHISLGAPVSVSLASCAVSSGCRPCLALPGWAGIRSPGTGSGSVPGSCPLPGRRKGLWGSRSPLPSSPVWGSRHRTSCLCARPRLHCGPVPWTAYPPLCSCCPHPHCLWESHCSRPAGEGRGGNVNILSICQLQRWLLL